MSGDPRLPLLPPGWTEHRAPTGHLYYWNAATQTSTYERPPYNPAPAPVPAVLAPAELVQDLAQEVKKDPNADRPRRKQVIPGVHPWILVITKKGRRFAHNLDTKESVWDIPEHVKEAIAKMERQEYDAAVAAMRGQKRSAEEVEEDEYEEEDAKRFREDSYEGGEGYEDDYGQDEQDLQQPEDVEFGEDDIMAQLAAMAEEGNFDPHDAQQELTPLERRSIFKDLLYDKEISPYGMWDVILADIVGDERYTAITTTTERKEVFVEYCKERLDAIAAEKVAAPKTDPKIDYLALLVEKAGKLYWPEFKRKYKKELAAQKWGTDKEKEKLFREYQDKRKAKVEKLEDEFLGLLRGVRGVRRSTTIETVPEAVRGDVRFVVVPEETRVTLLERHTRTLPEVEDDTVENPEAAAAHKAQQALRERERAVRDAKWRLNREIRQGQHELDFQARQIESAMRIRGNEGLASQLK
ncbi:hypothetical protein YB2330_000609 [Saitoella coloradoensis]